MRDKLNSQASHLSQTKGIPFHLNNVSALAEKADIFESGLNHWQNSPRIGLTIVLLQILLFIK